MPMRRPINPTIMRERGYEMEKNQQTLDYIVECIKESGDDPRAQIMGYLLTGNDCYITRTGNARGLIQSVDLKQLEQYVVLHKE